MGFSNFYRYLSVIAILGCEFCERLAAFGIGSSLTLFLRSKLGYSIESATVATAIWGAFATIFALLGGYISDFYWGRKKTIIAGAIVYFVALLTVSILTYLFELTGTDDLDLDTIEVIFWLCLYLMSVGAGGIKANVGIFGADQLHQITNSEIEAMNAPGLAASESDNVVTYDMSAAAMDAEVADRELMKQELVASYWNWFYFVINAGALISYTLISFLCQVLSLYMFCAFKCCDFRILELYIFSEDLHTFCVFTNFTHPDHVTQ